MEKILIIGGSLGVEITKALELKDFELLDIALPVDIDNVIIVTPYNIDQHKKEIMAQSPFEPEALMIRAEPKFDKVFIPRLDEKPFWQTMKKNKKKKR